MSFHTKYIDIFLKDPATTGAEMSASQGQYQARLTEATVAPGETYWRVIGVHHLLPDENRGNHNIFLEALDEAGQRIPRCVVNWGLAGQDQAGQVVLDKPDNEAAGNVVLWKDNYVWVEVAGAKSDRVENLHSLHPDEKIPGSDENGNMIGHHSFYIVFQRTVKAAAAAAKPAQPPQAVAWNARLTGFYGNRWGLWEQHFQDKLPGLTWDTFQREALTRNPHLAADKNVFYPDKTYLIPGDQDITFEPPMQAGQAAAPAPSPDTGQAPPPFEPIAGEDYSTLIPLETRTDRPANIHADLNLALRGYTPVNKPAERISISFDKPPDAKAPQLFGLFHDHRVPAFTQCYRVYKWDWGTPPDDPGRRSEAVEDRWDVSVLGMQTTAGETLHVPDSGYDIGQGCRAIVLYADEERLTLHYTARDDVIRGYTIHIEHIWVEPSLLARYRQQGGFNRSHLPGLRGGQAVGRAKGNEIKVAIRDTGQWMDPRSRLDWWQGK